MFDNFVLLPNGSSGFGVKSTDSFNTLSLSVQNYCVKKVYLQKIKGFIEKSEDLLMIKN